MREPNAPLTKAVFCLLTLLAWFVPGAMAQSTSIDRPKGTKGDSIIRGKAIYDDTEKPIRRVRVLLVSGPREHRQRRTAATDGNGEFTFKNVIGGSYRLIIDFAGRTGGNPRPDEEMGTPVTVAASSSTDVKLRVTRSASISGKVSYPDGEPVIGARVIAILKAGKQWLPPFMAPAVADTDDRGMYRIYPLPPGEYAVSVAEQGLVVQEYEGGEVLNIENKSFNPYYYQDANALKNATVIPVEIGRETSNINVILNERATYVVSGRVMANDKPVPNVSVRLTSREESGHSTMGNSSESARVDKDGNWSFKNVPDGFYTVELDPVPNGELRDMGKFLAANERLMVGGADVSGIVLNLAEAGRISGTVVVEGGKELPTDVDVSTELVSSNTPGRYHNFQSITLDARGGFLLSGVAPGENTLAMRIDEDHYVKSITWNSRDLLKQTIKVEGGRETKGVVVVVSAGVGFLTGRIVSADARKPLPGILYILVPADEMRWENRQGWRSGATEQDGTFEVSGAPGEYLFLALPNGAADLKSMADLKALLPRATRVMLKTTEQPEVEIVVPAN